LSITTRRLFTSLSTLDVERWNFKKTASE
jgi:hypothetical protein